MHNNHFLNLEIPITKPKPTTKATINNAIFCKENNPSFSTLVESLFESVVLFEVTSVILSLFAS